MIETENGDVLIKFEDYHILSMRTYCVINDGKHIIMTTVDYVKNQKHCRKVFKHILESEEK